MIRQLQQEGGAYYLLLKEIRHEIACQMLRDTDNTVEQIAASLGYAGASSFTRAFKTWTGITPANWRNRNIHCSVFGKFTLLLQLNIDNNVKQTSMSPDAGDQQQLAVRFFLTCPSKFSYPAYLGKSRLHTSC